MNESKPLPTTPSEKQVGAKSLRALFEAAIEMSVEQRINWLDLHCPAVLREKLMRMLLVEASSSESDKAKLNQWLFDADDVQEGWQAEGLLNHAIGGYRLLSVLGSGGMSCVFLAAREGADFEQKVAIKLLRQGLYTPLEQRLFQRERQILASLEHPNIARLIDGGVTDQGIPFLVMEYVDGESVTRFTRERSLTVRDKIKLIASICQAVDAAHRNLIVHRDIKPSNVLVTQDGQVKLLDFGIAKLLEQEDIQTRTIGTMLTPEYAAPEQFEGGRITPATDVYALGVMLHELLLGARPGKTPITRPSQLAQHGHNETLDVRTEKNLRQQLQGDLDNIILKCLEPETRLRYRDAGDLLDDINRYLEGRAVHAHPPSRWYRTKKFIQRHRGAVGVTATLVIAVLASLGLALWQARAARQQNQLATMQARRAENEAIRANTVRDFLLDLFEKAKPNLPTAERPDMMQLVRTASNALPAELNQQPAAKADLLTAVSEVLASWRDTEAALEAGKKAHETASTLPQHHPARITAQYIYAKRLNRSGGLALAEDLLQELIAIPEHELPKTLRRWQFEGTLMAVVAGEGRRSEALVIGRRMIHGFRLECARGARCKELGSAANDLAFVLKNDSQYTEAQRMFTESIQAYKRTKTDSAALQSAMHGLEDTTLILGDYPTSLAMAIESTQLGEAIYGPEHVWVPLFHLDATWPILFQQGPLAATQSLAKAHPHPNYVAGKDCAEAVFWRTAIFVSWRSQLAEIPSPIEVPDFPNTSAQNCPMAKDARVYDIDHLVWQAALAKTEAIAHDKLIKANQLASGISATPHKFAIRQNQLLGEVATYSRHFAVAKETAHRLQALADAVGQAESSPIRVEADIILACAKWSESKVESPHADLFASRLNALSPSFEKEFLTQFWLRCRSNQRVLPLQIP